MKPMRDLVLVEISQEPKEKEKGGLFYQAPRWAKPQNIGKCIETGPNVTTVEAGKYYLINPYSVIDTEDKTIKLVREGDVLCQMDDPDQS